MSSMEFPRQHVSIHKNCVPRELVEQIWNFSSIYAKAPNYWMPKECFEKGHSVSFSIPVEAAIWYLYHSVAKDRIPDDITGAEWWIQVYEGGSGLAFHFDKDEHIYKTEEEMIHPSFSSILYLTGMDEDRLRQACTVILDQRFDSQKSKTEPEAPKSCVFVPPSIGKYCLFDGGLGHGVLDASNTDRRATMLINWWKAKPKSIERPTEQELTQLAFEQRTESESSISLFSPSPITVKDVPKSIQMQYPVIQIPTEDEDVKESGILVDDLLDAYLLDAFGANAIQAVGVRYEGHVLYPIDPSKTKQDISKKLIIPAAFIPESVQVGP